MNASMLMNANLWCGFGNCCTPGILNIDHLSWVLLVCMWCRSCGSYFDLQLFKCACWFKLGVLLVFRFIVCCRCWLSYLGSLSQQESCIVVCMIWSNLNNWIRVQILRSGQEQLPFFGALVTCKVLQQELCVCHTDQGGQPGAFAKVRSWPEAQEGHLKQKVQEVVADDHLQGLAGWSSCCTIA